MPSLVFKNAYFEINGTNLSTFVKSLKLNYAAASLDETAMGIDSKKMKGGLKEWSVDVDFIQGQGAGTPEAVLFGLVGCQACMEVRPQNICSTASNPKYSGTALVQSFPPVSGNVGELLTATVKLDNAGDLSRASSS